MAGTHDAARTSRRSVKSTFLWVALALIVLVLAAVAWVGVRGLLAVGELRSAVPLASRIQQEVVAGDGGAAGKTFELLDAHASTAASLTGDPVWRAFEVMPVLGPNLTAVREVATSVNDISQRAVKPLTVAAGGITLSDFKPVDGAIDLQPLIDAQPSLSAASTALGAAQKRVDAIDTSGTLSPVTDAVEELKASVAEACESVNAIDRAVRLLPNMLGASGPRDYVLLFQNPAELRASGGNPGAIALIHTEDGRIGLAQQASTGNFPEYDTPVLELPAETLNLYGDITGRYMQDVSLTPQFPLTGKLAREMWRLEFGIETDGVMSIDPIALGYLLKATGPITLPTGDVITADNAVQLLLTDVYARYENPAEQDAFFAAAAAAVFTAVSSGNVDPMALIEALARAGSERRVLVWSARDDEQAVLVDTTLAGGLPFSDDDTTRFGVYLNDGTGSKMGPYLDVQVGAGKSVCREDERPNYRVEVTLTNTAPADAATALSGYVTGAGDYGVPPGNVKTVLSVYGAPGMQNLGMSRDGAEVGYLPTTDSTNEEISYPVSQVSVELAPGESTALQFNWLGAKASKSEIVTESTPVINPHETQSVAFACENP